jgi:hypothetical protein
MTQAESNDMNLLFTFRKTLLVSILYVVGIIFRVTNLIDGAQFVDLLKGVTVAFLASNSFEFATSSVRSYMGNQGQTPTPDASAISTVSK